MFKIQIILVKKPGNHEIFKFSATTVATKIANPSDYFLPMFHVISCFDFFSNQISLDLIKFIEKYNNIFNTK